MARHVIHQLPLSKSVDRTEVAQFARPRLPLEREQLVLLTGFLPPVLSQLHAPVNHLPGVATLADEVLVLSLVFVELGVDLRLLFGFLDFCQSQLALLLCDLVLVDEGLAPELGRLGYWLRCDWLGLLWLNGC